MYTWCSYRFLHPEASAVGQDMVKAVKVLQRFYRLKKYRRGHGAMRPWAAMGPWYYIYIYPLVMTNIAMGNGPNRNRWYIDVLPSYKMVISHGDLLNNQMEYIYIYMGKL